MLLDSYPIMWSKIDFDDSHVSDLSPWIKSFDERSVSIRPAPVLAQTDMPSDLFGLMTLLDIANRCNLIRDANVLKIMPYGAMGISESRAQTIAIGHWLSEKALRQQRFIGKSLIIHFPLRNLHLQVRYLVAKMPDEAAELHYRWSPESNTSVTRLMVSPDEERSEENENELAEMLKAQEISWLIKQSAVDKGEAYKDGIMAKVGDAFKDNIVGLSDVKKEFYRAVDIDTKSPGRHTELINDIAFEEIDVKGRNRKEVYEELINSLPEESRPKDAAERVDFLKSLENARQYRRRLARGS